MAEVGPAKPARSELVAAGARPLSVRGQPAVAPTPSPCGGCHGGGRQSAAWTARWRSAPPQPSARPIWEAGPKDRCAVMAAGRPRATHRALGARCRSGRGRPRPSAHRTGPALLRRTRRRRQGRRSRQRSGARRTTPAPVPDRQDGAHGSGFWPVGGLMLNPPEEDYLAGCDQARAKRGQWVDR